MRVITATAKRAGGQIVAITSPRRYVGRTIRSGRRSGSVLFYLFVLFFSFPRPLPPFGRRLSRRGHNGETVRRQSYSAAAAAAVVSSRLCMQKARHGSSLISGGIQRWRARSRISRAAPPMNRFTILAINPKTYTPPSPPLRPYPFHRAT